MNFLREKHGVTPVWWWFDCISFSSPKSSVWFISRCTDNPPFSKVHFIPHLFYERSALVLVFTNWRGFLLLWRKVKSKSSMRRLFLYGVMAAVHTPSSGSDASRLLSRKCTQYQAAIALSCVSIYLSFISIYFVHPLARRILR